jgi:hypothetical protein
LGRPLVRAAVATAFAALVLISTDRMVVATAVLPEVPLVDDPFADYLMPRWSAGQLAVNTIPVAGPSDENRTAWNLGQKMGLEGRASLLPLAGFVSLVGLWLVREVRRAVVTNGRPPSS